MPSTWPGTPASTVLQIQRSAPLKVNETKSIEFKTSDLCKATGILLEHRGRYYVTVQPGERWFNGLARDRYSGRRLFRQG